MLLVRTFQAFSFILLVQNISQFLEFSVYNFYATMQNLLCPNFIICREFNLQVNMTVINHVINRNLWFKALFYHIMYKKSEISVNYLIYDSHLNLETKFLVICEI